MSNVTIPYSRALVTGASSGIGEAICYRLDASGVERIVLVARDKQRLAEVASRLQCDTEIVVADLTCTEDVERVAEALSNVDLLVNNAGVGSFGPFHRLGTDQQVAMIDLNCRAPIHLASKALSHMTEHQHGCVVNIASGMSFQAMPYFSTYSASKAFLLHWSQGVHAELRGTGVRMVAICPGTFHTNFAETAAVPLHDILGASLVTGSVEEVAQRTIDAIRTNQATVITGFTHRLVLFLNRLAPSALVRRITAWAMRRTYRKTID